MTKREAVLGALFARLQTITGATVLRNAAFDERFEGGSLIILRDGDPGDPEIILSPTTYIFTHTAELEAAVIGPENENDANFDALMEAIGAALNGDPTLSGACDRMTPRAPQTAILPVQGGDAGVIKAATVPIELIYATADALG